ncbi:uncharacterized protein DSM5745_06914 [Aspergillus mulundensis]|uniref:RGS domain-containing protein n=1 Tax=Aspergillus mulundensis TaxID=1810919 RepID=A0A3D8RJP2_9EURO|nr:Uncharacterized protein DSM5745_06914 [Aspergillus mulundensis]RDW74252.1 Uncharacterized protein DSM5745_06914 [Aspergillus mulundensis]
MGSELGITPDTKPAAVYSPVAIWWVVWGCLWTAVVASGVVFLVLRRNSPILRVRSLWLSLGAIGFLHIYFWSCQFGVMIGPLMPGDAQYWIMGTWLPCGLALFHGSNSYFLHIAKLQKKYAKYSFLTDSTPDVKRRQAGFLNRFRRMEYTTRVVVLVGIAMFVQILLTVLMWVISRKFHRGWGAPGTEVHGPEMAQKAEQGRGWEWWPGVFWQFFWSWVVAPLVLWNSRHIHDTQGWRSQTIGCAVSGLHATPMWLIALYVPAMEKVNAVWIPPQWICISIVFLEIFTVLLPCWEVMRHQSLHKDTLEAIKQWEARTKGNNSDNKSLGSTATMVDSMMSGWKSNSDSVLSDNSARESILNMSALEYVLERNPTPLQRFSALNDFSGENVAFLTSITEWKSLLPKALLEGDEATDDITKEMVREAFNRALYIYAEFISTAHAEFPVNISSQDLKKLDLIFEMPARILYGDEKAEVDPATPFNQPGMPSPTYSNFSESSVAAIKNRAQYMGDIPKAFTAGVFDDAENSIKYLVLTNTWPKFVKRQRRISTDSTETLHVEGNADFV